jgi:mRNA-degrading endonuclease RelE of RelBE toxin-antitoxin system
MAYEVVIDEDAMEYHLSLDEKDQRIVKRNLLELEDDPHPRPGAGRGDREKIVYQGEQLYRLHISRTYTAIYDIIESKSRVEVLDLLPIDDAHKRYGH